MNTEIAVTNGNHALPSAVEAALAEGNLAKLSTDGRIAYYNATCSSLGINPLTRPFEYITLNGKLTLYATRACTEQLRSTRKVSVSIISRENIGDVYVVTARAVMADGRADESTGAVSVGGLKGDALCNALMKAETKAKRRVTLSICGLGFLDESEVETIPGARDKNRFLSQTTDFADTSPTPSLQNGGIRPAVTEAALNAIHDTFGTENPWLHCIASERSPSRGKALFELPETAWQKIHENPAKALSHFCEADQAAIYACMANPELRPE